MDGDRNRISDTFVIESSKCSVLKGLAGGHLPFARRPFCISYSQTGQGYDYHMIRSVEPLHQFYNTYCGMPGPSLFMFMHLFLFFVFFLFFFLPMLIVSTSSLLSFLENLAKMSALKRLKTGLHDWEVGFTGDPVFLVHDNIVQTVITHSGCKLFTFH